MVLASTMPAQSAIAQNTAAPTDKSAVDAFRDICIRSGGKMDAVVAAAEASGFSHSTATPAAPPGTTKVAALERGNGTAKLVVVASAGMSAVSKSLTAEAPFRGCAITGTSAAADVRGFAREWVGISPQFDADGVIAYNYLERANGNISAPDNDLSALIDAVNAGELRVLAVRDIGTARALSWLIFEAPSKPWMTPASLAIRHDSDPFSPCKWETVSTGRNAQHNLSCPDKSGTFRSTFAREVNEETPALARNGDVAAMLKLATFYSDGPRPLRDRVSAFAWSNRAAEAGAPGGAFNLGLAYDDGMGVVADKAQAQRWYRTAIERQHTSAMVNLAALLLNGSNDTNSAYTSEALGLVRRAADAGSTTGIFNMGYLYEKGIGLAKDMTEALRWYRLAAERKDSRAMLRLGLLYADGVGGVAWTHHVAGQESEQVVAFIHHGEGPKAESLLLDEGEDVTNEFVGRDFDRFLDEAVDVVLDAADGGELLSLGFEARPLLRHLDRVTVDLEDLADG